MRKRILVLLAVVVALLCSLCLASCGSDEDTNQSGNGPTKLNAPVVTLEGNVAKWEANENADKFEISLDGNLSYVENVLTSKTLEKGQSLKVRAVGDGVNYATSDWSNVVTCDEGDTQNSGSSSNQGNNPDTPSGGSSSNQGNNPDTPSGGSSSNQGNDPDTPSGGSSSNQGNNPDTPSGGSSSNQGDKPDNPSDKPDNDGDAPEYLGIIVSEDKPREESGVPSDIVPRPALLSSRVYLGGGVNSVFDEYFSSEQNYLGEYPEAAEYDLFGTPGQTVYIQIWLNNPSQYTILSLKLNGTKYQIGGNLFSFFVEENGAHYNCVYAAVTVPENAFVEIDYTVTDIEYIANTFINADGTDEFMNENDTISIGLPYSDKDVEISTLEPTELTTDSYSVSFDVIDEGNVILQSGSWIGFAIYDGESFVYNKSIEVGANEINVSTLAENTEYIALVYIFGDLHDGNGVVAHVISECYFTTKGAVEYFELEAGYYQHWSYPEIGVEADSGLCINVSAALSSQSATFDRLELYKGDELIYTNNEFGWYESIEDLLADTEYRVRVYFSDKDYTEHFVEQTVVTGRMEKPEMKLQGAYSFLNSAAITFDYLENGFLRLAVAKNVRVRIYRADIWQLSYMDWILKLCDDPELVDRVQAEFDEAIANGDWGLASKIDHESLTFLRQATDIINSEELGNFGTDRAKWEEYFETVSRTYYLDVDEDFFTSTANSTSYLIFRDYFSMFEENSRYEIIADVDMKDGYGFVSTVLSDGDIRSVHPVNHEYNRLEFDYEIDGLKVTVNPKFRVNGEDNDILVVSYKIGLYTTNGKLVDTLYESREVEWSEFNEDEWINAYVCAMKGEAIIPSEDKIKEYFGWRVIFETLLNVEIEYEDDYIGGGNGEVVVRPGDGTTAEGGIVVGGGRGEKNIANQRERQIIRDMLAYDYPDWYEYRLKESILESFMQDESYYDLIDGIDGVDEQLEALISGALNSTISSVLGTIESGIYHYMSWFGTDTDEIYLGYKQVMEEYIEEMGYNPQVNWGESYQRVMTFADFYEFYPFGYTETFYMELDPTKYEAGKYMIGIAYRYDSYEDDRYEVDYPWNNEIVITGNLPVPKISLDNEGYVAEIKADLNNFWDYRFEIQIKNAQGTVVFTGRQDELNESSGALPLKKGFGIRARAVLNEGAYSEIYSGNSEWSDWLEFEGARLETPYLEYNERESILKWYAYSDYISHYVLIKNNGVGVTIPKNFENFIYLEYGDVIKVKAVPNENGIAVGYLESYWAEYTCEDNRPSLSAPLNITIIESEKRVEWTAVDGAEYYILEFSKGSQVWTEEIWNNRYDGLEIGVTYRVRAISNSGEVKSSPFSEAVTYTVKLENPKLYRANQNLVVWSEVPNAEGYNYKIGENGAVNTIKIARLEMSKLAVGDSLYVQAYAEGCESSDWVLIYTRTSEVIEKV